MRPIARYVEAAEMRIDELAKAAELDEKLVKAIVDGNYNASPHQRQRLAAALGVEIKAISWGHAVPVEYMRGNGPQSGRPT